MTNIGIKFFAIKKDDDLIHNLINDEFTYKY